MASNSSMSREHKKKQLKRQVVPPDRGENEEESREIVHKAHRHVIWRRFTIFWVLAAIAAVAAFVLFRYDRLHQFTDYQVMWKKSFANEAQQAAVQGEGSFCAFKDFGDGVLKYTKDGVSYIDAQGKVVWVQSYEMKSPVVAVNGDYAAIGDQQGNSIYICNKTGFLGQATTLLPILRVTISAKGLVAALQEDSKASYIYYYNKDGTDFGIDTSSLLSGDGYPVDLSMSPDGTQLITSYMYLDKGMIKCKIVFYNFELGKNDPKRVVGIFFPQDLGDAMAGRVSFLDDSNAVIFTDKGIQLFSTRVKTSPELTKQIPIEQNIRSIAYTDEYLGLVTDNASGGDPYDLEIFDKQGNSVFSHTFSYQYTGFDIDGGMVLLYNDNSCQVFNMTGTEKYNGTFDFTVSKVSAGRFPGTLLVMGPQMMEEIKLQ